MKTIDAIILGGGPAGASCALWLKLLGRQALLIEKSKALGGLQNRNPYPNSWILGKSYKRGSDFAKAIHVQLKAERVPYKTNKAVKIEKRGNLYVAPEASVQAPFLVLATGVHPMPPDFEITDKVKVGAGYQLEDLNLKNKRVALLGGGDNGFENYILLKKKSPKVMKVFARHIRAQKQFVEKVPKQDVRVGNYRVDPHRGTVNDEEFDLLVVLYGWECTNPVKQIFPLQYENGFIKTDDHRRTSVSGIYAIGEITQRVHPCCVTAMSDGIIAAKHIQKELENNFSTTTK